MTSFYNGLTQHFNTTSTIYLGMCVPSFVSLYSRSGGIARKKIGAKITPQWLAGGAEAQRPPGSAEFLENCTEDTFSSMRPRVAYSQVPTKFRITARQATANRRPAAACDVTLEGEARL